MEWEKMTLKKLKWGKKRKSNISGHLTSPNSIPANGVMRLKKILM